MSKKIISSKKIKTCFKSVLDPKKVQEKKHYYILKIKYND